MLAAAHKKLRAPWLTLTRRCDAPTTVPSFVSVFLVIVNRAVCVCDSAWEFLRPIEIGSEGAALGQTQRRKLVIYRDLLGFSRKRFLW